MPTVSIIIPVYNYADYVGAAITTVLQQECCDWECILVDDGSTDDSAARIVKHINIPGLPARKFQLIRHGNNRGYAAAYNTGIAHSRGSFIRTLDADDCLLPNALEMALARFETHPHADLVHGPALRWYGGDDIRGFNAKTYCHAQGRMYRRSVFERFGAFYEGLRSMADKELIYRLGVHPESPLPRLIHDVRIDQPVALYRKHPMQMHKVRRGTKREKQIEKTFRWRIKQLRREGITRENTPFPI